MKLPISGGCLCGEVTYEIAEQPLKMGICHCRTCQQATGSANYPFLVTNDEALNIKGKVVEYTSTGATGNPVHRAFCPHCGSRLFGRPEAWPGIRTISASSLDSPADFKPEMNVWVEDAQSWGMIDSNLENFDSGRRK